jgi:hypothetical protein
VVVFTNKADRVAAFGAMYRGQRISITRSALPWLRIMVVFTNKADRAVLSSTEGSYFSFGKIALN